MWLITCLGNPGQDYEKNRHNVGFRVGEFWINYQKFVKKSNKFKSKVFDGIIEDQKILLILPQTYMNLSGEAAAEAMAYYKIPPEKLLVIYDDFDIEFGSLRIRKNGSAGTHNGMKSIVGLIKSENFPRLRIGIGPKPPHVQTADFVLSDFSKSEEKIMPQILKACAESCECLLTSGIDRAMNQFNKFKVES